MRTSTTRIAMGLLLAVYVLTHFLGHAHAQSSLGIGVNEAMTPSTGLFGSILAWVNARQQEFYRALTGALRAMRDGESGTWLLVGLSFAYGVFHAAGPGHGKAVISSYMLANEVALRRGVMLSFASALMQALTAIVLMGAVFALLRGTAVSMTSATWYLEVASYAAVTLFGLWLLWQKAWPRLRGMTFGRPARSLSSAGVVHHDHDDHANCTHPHHRLGGYRGRQTATFGGGQTIAVCEDCGHAHVVDPSMLGGERFDWRAAWSAVVAVGLRPCSGALIVLTFAFLNGLWVAGLVSVLAMALGTAITVSVLATLAVTAKNVAVRFAGDGRMGNRIHAGIEISGAALVFLLGATLLAASLSA